ncbi:serine kinase [bacterium]|nr:serine kinase [bacterium]
MKLKAIVDVLSLESPMETLDLERDVTGGYVSDLLSDVIAHTHAGDIWITLQVHPNTIAVATLKELTAIIVIGENAPAEAAVSKAASEGIAIFTTDLPAFEVVGKLYEMGLRGQS